MVKGASVQAVTVLGPGAGQLPAVVSGVVAGNGPWMRLATVTRDDAISGVKPTAPFQVNIGLVAAGFPVAHGAAPLVAPSVVAGSPRVSGTLLTSLNGVLKIYGYCVPGRPAAMSARPESGPNENMKIWFPSPIVE
jgi:hypothetical protein